LKSANITLEETVSRQKSRIETLETSHRDTLTLLEKKNVEILRNEEEYKQLHTKYIEARRKISNTETALQEAQGQVSTLGYKEQGLQQEVEFLRKDHDRVVSELNVKTTDFSAYRKEKVPPRIYCIDSSLHKSLAYNLNLKKFPLRQIPTQKEIVF
jgi:chromosome segregation ATPase